METITIKRPSVVTDEYGNEVPGPLATVGTVEMLVAPQVKDEPKLLGRTPIETNYNLYNRSAADTNDPSSSFAEFGPHGPSHAAAPPYSFGITRPSLMMACSTAKVTS